ncbi:MAG: 2-oxoglutarate dehydrogenase complex dihydrolipoyllysine-residue succinyltransferase [Chloroflexales bacterium]|nr:2-oxoglutarate dehydrogenase complex dihydrolipoyllysine-residue succinyltransferase [Chloroflexales bacterium]
MNVDINVPILGESIVEGTLAHWHKKVGEAIYAGEILADLETDKVNIEVTASAAGVITALHKNEGDTVGVGELIASIDTASTAASPAPVAAATGGATPVAVAHSPVNDAPATPVARNVAADTGVDLRTVSGSGPDGRITKNDVIKASAPVPGIINTAKPTPVVASGSRSEERVKMSRRRQTIATRLVQAQQTAAMLTTFNEVDLTRVMDIRKRKKDSFKEHNSVGLGFMSFFTKASISALKAFPDVNAEIQGDEILHKYYYDIGIAVSTPDGLVVPVLRDADNLSFAGIEKGIESLAKKARENKLGLAEITGGTFTITNGGVFGSMMSTPILNMPQVGILGMHKIQERAMVMNGQIVIRPMMYIALSYDHRIIDGATAVRFLVHIKDLLEDPDSLLLEF